MVGKEFNDEHMDALFAGTPPLASFRFLIHEAATVRPDEKMGSKVLMIKDVARALFEALAIRYMWRSPRRTSQRPIVDMTRSVTFV